MKSLANRAADWVRAQGVILKLLDEATSPDRMSKVEARDSMRQLVTDIQVRIDALTEEIGE